MPEVMRRAAPVVPILACFGGGSLYGWSGYMPAVQARFDLGHGAGGLVFSLALVSFTAGVLLGPSLLARLPERRQILCAAAFAAAGLLGAALSSGLALFAFGFSVVFGGASGALYNLAVSIGARHARAHFLVPISVAVFALGGAVFGPLHLWLGAQGWGLWSVWPALAVLLCVVGLSLGLTPVPAPTGHSAETRVPVANAELLRLWAVFAAGSCAGLVVLGFAAQMVGAEAAFAARAIGLAAVGNTLGRLSAAPVAHRFGPAKGMAFALALTILALGGLMLRGTPDMVTATLFCVALGYGHLAAQMPLLVRAQVPQADFSRAFGWVFTGWGVAGLAGPWTAGVLFDAAGSMRPALMLCAVLCALSLGLLVPVVARSRPARENVDISNLS